MTIHARTRTVYAIALAAGAAMFASSALAAGTAADAKAMLDKTVAALKADKAKISIRSTRQKTASWSATSIHSASISATA